MSVRSQRRHVRATASATASSASSRSPGHQHGDAEEVVALAGVHRREVAGRSPHDASRRSGTRIRSLSEQIVGGVHVAEAVGIDRVDGPHGEAGAQPAQGALAAGEEVAHDREDLGHVGREEERRPPVRVGRRAGPAAP